MMMEERKSTHRRSIQMQTETGDLFDIGEIQPMTVWSDVAVKPVCDDFTMTAEVSAENIYDVLVNKVVASQFDIEVHREVPARHHRKKRIQKKWIKRYGVRDSIHPLGRFHMEESSLADGSVVFIGTRNPELNT